jgi:RNA polymerase sigma-70 factor (ECF subfamily)
VDGVEWIRMNEERELQLVEAWQRGDSSAGERLFERYFDRLCAFFRTKVNDGVDDLVQATLTSCLGSRERLNNPASFRAYVFRAAKNALYDHLAARRETRPLFSASSLADLEPTVSSLVARRQRQAQLITALHTLPLDLQVLVELAYWEQMNSSELAHVLGCPAPTVRSRLRRARALLAESLGPEIDDAFR